jgi:hypothetical protein
VGAEPVDGLGGVGDQGVDERGIGAVVGDVLVVLAELLGRGGDGAVLVGGVRIANLRVGEAGVAAALVPRRLL